jgi:hypothetical protein
MRVDLHPSSVMLDYQANEMEIRGTVINRAGVPPTRIWVWAYFVNPAVSTTGSWSDSPIEISNPFVEGDSVAISARGRFHWATNPDLPRTGYFARASVSAETPEAAQIPSSARTYDTDGAIEVRTQQ